MAKKKIVYGDVDLLDHENTDCYGHWIKRTRYEVYSPDGTFEASFASDADADIYLENKDAARLAAKKAKRS